jgi:PIN domain nuclease of toxin-antitoxin system
MSGIKYLMDTHVWIWWNARPDSLSKCAREAISSTPLNNELLLAGISLWEFGKMISQERLVLSRTPESWIAESLNLPGLRIVHLNPSIALGANASPCIDLIDPVNQILAATARDEGAIIITKDQELQDNRHVQTLW